MSSLLICIRSFLTVEQAHDISVAAQKRVIQHHRVLHLLTHIDPWRRPDLDHAAAKEG